MSKCFAPRLTSLIAESHGMDWIGSLSGRTAGETRRLCSIIQIGRIPRGLGLQVKVNRRPPTWRMVATLFLEIRALVSSNGPPPIHSSEALLHSCARSRLPLQLPCARCLVNRWAFQARRQRLPFAREVDSTSITLSQE